MSLVLEVLFKFLEKRVETIVLLETVRAYLSLSGAKSSDHALAMMPFATTLSVCSPGQLQNSLLRLIAASATPARLAPPQPFFLLGTLCWSFTASVVESRKPGLSHESCIQWYAHIIPR